VFRIEAGERAAAAPGHKRPSDKASAIQAPHQEADQFTTARRIFDPMQTIALKQPRFFELRQLLDL
jgi:hypothetical protein